MAPGSLVALWVRADPAQKQQLVSFEVVEADTLASCGLGLPIGQVYQSVGPQGLS